MTTETTKTITLTAAIAQRRISVVSGAYTHRLTNTLSTDPTGGPVTACGIIVDPILTRRGIAADVDCPYCQGRRSRFESKVAR